MGANCQCGASSGNTEEPVKLTPRSADPVSIYPAKVPEPFQILQGSWSTQGDLQRMGAIVGTAVVWDKVFNLDQSSLRVNAAGEFEMNLSGTTHKARFDAKTDRLLWSDGEVWVRR
ncbi:plekha8 [Symbiodinium natans]|uniref:Plekha8 protein n=1 Tax=Symbiodinium natans TaxID=878477 RepID=A0A812T2K5_9DINO|nr:plekha8 [Symbiodinium natans]